MERPPDTPPPPALDTPRLTIKDMIRQTKTGIPMKAAAERMLQRKRKKDDDVNTPPPPSPPRPVVMPEVRTMAPQIKIVDGRIVLNEDSLTVTAAPRDDITQFAVVHENDKHITSATYMKRTPSDKWGAEETKLFYKALRMYGTDFTLIEKLFKDRTRRQIKNKYKKEEKDNPSLIDHALKSSLPIDLEQYQELSGLMGVPAVAEQPETVFIPMLTPSQPLPTPSTQASSVTPSQALPMPSSVSALSAVSAVSAMTTGTADEEDASDTETPAKEKKKAKKKDPLAPKQPPSAFLLFCNDQRPKFQEKLSFQEMGKILGQKWAALPDTDKEPYQESAKKLKEQYKIDKTAYEAKKLMESSASTATTTTTSTAATVAT